MTWRGDAFELPTWEPRTDVTGSSPLLGTPTARDWKGPGMAHQLPTDLALLPTPLRAAGEQGPNGQRRGPTPMARDGRSDGSPNIPSKNGSGTSLMKTLPKLLPTPTAADGTKVARNKTGGRKPDSKHHTGTTMQAVAYEWAGKLLPTPRKVDGQRNRVQESSPGWRPTLEQETLSLSSGASTSPPSDDGKPSTAARPRLSPEFVEWMMGTPRCNECGRGWTDSACQHSVTAFTSTSAGSSGTRS
jgi:hypothetical protein